MIVPVNSFSSFSFSGSPCTLISLKGILFCERNSFASWQSIHVGLVNNSSVFFAIDAPPCRSLLLVLYRQTIQVIQDYAFHQELIFSLLLSLFEGGRKDI